MPLRPLNATIHGEVTWKRFQQFERYHPKEGVRMTEIENEFSETERANEKVLGRYRDQRLARGER
jgi:hypothetical protein